VDIQIYIGREVEGQDRGFMAETTQRAEGETYRQAITEATSQVGDVGMTDLRQAQGLWHHWPLSSH
jgi:hypothetical protein